MTTRQALYLIQRIVKLILLYFGGKEMSMKSNNLKIPTFLQKATAEVKAEKPYVSKRADISVPDDFMNPPVEPDEVEESEPVRVAVEGSQKGFRNDATVEDRTVSPMERDALIRSIKGMSQEQLEIMLDNVPIEMVYNRLGRELERNKAFIRSMKGAMSLIDATKC